MGSPISQDDLLQLFNGTPVGISKFSHEGLLTIIHDMWRQMMCHSKSLCGHSYTEVLGRLVQMQDQKTVWSSDINVWFGQISLKLVHLVTLPDQTNEEGGIHRYLLFDRNNNWKILEVSFRLVENQEEWYKVRSHDADQMELYALIQETEGRLVPSLVHSIKCLLEGAIATREDTICDMHIALQVVKRYQLSKT